MADIVLAHQQREHIEQIVVITKSAQRQVGRIHSEGARLAIDTLTQTTERIQAAARNGMPEETVQALIEQQKEYLWTMQRIANQGVAGLQALVTSLPALPG